MKDGSEQATKTPKALLAELEQVRVELDRERAARASLEVSLRESQARNRSLYDQAPVMLHSIDGEGRLLSVSDHWLRVLGYAREEVIGRRSTDFLTPESQRYARETILPDYFRTGICTDVAYQMLTKTGEVREVLLSAIAERDAEGRPARSFAVMIDITDRKRIEEEFHRAQKLESLGVLASGVAHDFNNLLVGIYGFLDLALLETKAESTLHGYVQEAKKAARHAADLVLQLLAYAGKGSAAKSAVDLNTLIRDMLDLLKTSASKKITLRTELPEGLPPLHADATQLRQIVLNLVTNAAQAIGDRPGQITIRTAQACALKEDAPACAGGSAKMISLQVEDTGSGLDAATRARIFDPFFTTKPGGSGLGLAAVHGIVSSHGGSITVESSPGRGSVFCICLPADLGPAETAAPDPTVRAMPEDWSGQGLALLVDDEPRVLRVGGAMLERLGFEVLTAVDGEEAVALFRARAHEIVCVVLDYNMPRMNGAEVFQALRALRPKVPVVLSTGYARPEATAELLRDGLSGFVQKPYALSRLREALRTALESA